MIFKGRSEDVRLKGNAKRLLVWSIIGTGISSVTVQLITIREFLTQFHPALLYLYQLGIFMAFWGTIYGAYEIYIRTAYECLLPLSRPLRTMPVRHFRAAVLAYCGLGGLALLWLTEDAEVIVQPAAILGGVFTCGLWCFAMLWTDRRFLPKALRMGKTLAALTWISGIVLTGLGMLAIYDYVKVLVT